MKCYTKAKKILDIITNFLVMDMDPPMRQQSRFRYSGMQFEQACVFEESTNVFVYGRLVWYNTPT